MRYLVDTDIVIDHLENVPETVTLLDRLASNGLAMSMITYMEAFQGVARRGPTPDHAEARLEELIRVIPIIPFSAPVARRCARLREQLRGVGKKTRDRSLDLIIAATALEHGLFLITRNVNDYSDIPGL